MKMEDMGMCLRTQRRKGMSAKEAEALCSKMMKEKMPMMPDGAMMKDKEMMEKKPEY